MRRLLVIFAVLLFACGIFFFFCNVRVWDGYHQISVTIHNLKASQIQSIWSDAIGRQIEAQYVLDKTIAGEPCEFKMTERKLVGDAVQVEVPVWGRTLDLSGIEVSHGQFPLLLVVVKYENGETLGKIVDIPDVRKSSSVIVEVP